MAVADATILIVLLCALNWGLIYRFHKFVGAFFFFLIGIGTIATTLNSTPHAFAGIFIMFIGLFLILGHWADVGANRKRRRR